MFIGKNTLHFLISTVVVLLLVQYASGNVIRTAEETDLSTKGNQTSEGKQKTAVQKFNTEIVSFVSNEYNTFANDSLYSIKRLLEKVIQDADAYEGAHSKYLQDEVERFKKFISELQKLEEDNNNVGKYDLLADIAEILDAYNTTVIKEPSDEVSYIENILNKYGWKELVNELDIALEHFAERLKVKAHEIWQQMPAEERGSDKYLKNWLENIELLKTLYSWH